MSGGKSWSLQVPVNFDKDPDVLISELCKRFKHLLSKQEPSKVSTPLICRQDLLSLKTEGILTSVQNKCFKKHILTAAVTCL